VFVSCSQLHVAQGILSAQSIINQLEGKINNDFGGSKGTGRRNGGDGHGRGKGKGKGQGKNRINTDELANQLNDLRASIGKARDGIALALQGGVNVLQQQGKSIKQLFEDAGLAVPQGF
jgi:hypothetical protein